MAFKRLEIAGLRGFGKEQAVEFAIPSSESGSGLTFIVGANNSGKTTIYEAIRSFITAHHAPSFSVGKRNVNYHGGRIHMKLIYDNGEYISIETDKRNGSQTEITRNGRVISPQDLESRIAILQSRRYVEYSFPINNGDTNRAMKGLLTQLNECM